MIFDFEAALWRWEVRTELWTFVSLPAENSEIVRELMSAHEGRGFGAVRVRAAIGITTWRTSIFPDGDHYVLPVKRSVREAEGLELGGSAQVQVNLDPTVGGYCAAPSGHPGCVADAQWPTRPPSRRAPCQHTRLVPLATPPIVGSRLD